MKLLDRILVIRHAIIVACKPSAEYTFRAHFTNDFIWDLFLKYHKEHLNGRRYCDVANYCNVIYHTIEGISLYDAEGAL